MLGIGFAPRLLGMVDVLLRPGGAARYGGRLRLMLGGLVDLLFSLLLGPVMMIAQARFVFGLAFGHRVTWEAQNRAGRAVPVAEALRGLWPQLAFGVAASAVLIRFAPGVLPLAAPTLLPCLLAIPFACFGASRFAGRLFVRLGLCAVPEERDVPALKRAKG
jgi:membrane glycosyltransferase